MKHIAYSEYQLRFFQELKETNNSILLNAKAGSGKTTTIEHATKFIPRNKDVIFLAFNRTIKEELRNRLPLYITVKTLHSFAFGCLYKHYKKLTLSENKCFVMGLKLYKKEWHAETDEAKYVYTYRISKLVDLMRCTLTTNNDEAIRELANMHGIMIFNKEIEHARQLLKVVYNRTDVIDYTDMIFQLAVRDIKVPKYDYVIVDEVQDLNKAQHAIIKKIIRPTTGRLIAVGDPNQSIYGFAGADVDSYNRVATLRPNTVQLPLSVCYRCTQQIIVHAQGIVPDIQYNPDAPVGEAPETLPFDVNIIKAGDWVLCRNVRPLVQLFRLLIYHRKKAHIKGREIGADIINLIEKTKAVTIAKCFQMIEVYKIKLKSKLYRYGYAQPETHPQWLILVEKQEIIKMLGQGLHTCKQLIKTIESIFHDEDTPDIVLSTIHRAKGMEADNVYLLRPGLIPSKYAETAKQLEQEMNLMYVARTRGRKRFHYFNPTDEELEPGYRRPDEQLESPF